MTSSRQSDPLSRGDKSVEVFLLQYEMRIRLLVMKYIQHQLKRPGLSSLEMNDLVQEIGIRIWRTLQKGNITNPHALITRIVRSVVIDTLRRSSPTYWLSITADGELHYGYPLMTPSEGMQDPAYEFEQTEIDPGRMKQIVCAILQLPPRQQEAILCSLNDQFDRVHSAFVAMLLSYGLDIKAAHWPDDDPAQLRSLKTSLVIARIKLHLLLDHPKNK